MVAYQGSSGRQSAHQNHYRTVPSQLTWRSDKDNIRLNRPHVLPPGQSFHRRPKQEPFLKQQETHTGWLEVEVSLWNVHPETTTWDLFRRFNEEGHIVFIEISEDRKSVKNGYAKLRFCQPPPLRPFWERDVTMSSPMGEGTVLLRAQLKDSRRNFQIQSHVRNHIWYPQLLSMDATALHFGLMYDDATMMVMQTFEAKLPTSPVRFTLDMRRKELMVQYTIDFKDPRDTQTAAQETEKGGQPLGYNDRSSEYRFALPFKQLDKLYRVDIDDQHWGLFATFGNPPKVFRKVTQIEATHKEKTLMWSENDAWYRQTDVMYNPLSLRTTSVSIFNNDQIIDLGHWTTYRLVFRKDQDIMNRFKVFQEALHDWNVEVVDGKLIQIIPGRPSVMRSLLNVSETGNGKQWFGDKDDHVHLPFEVRYQFEVCLSQGLINEHNVTKEFFLELAKRAEALAKKPTTSSQNGTNILDIDAIDQTSNARTILEYVSERGNRVCEPMTIFSDKEALAYSPSCKMPHYCAMVRKATITPTQMLLSAPTVETTNRVLRNYSTYGDRFLRVQFTDEKSEGAINSSADKTINDELFTRVFRTLKNGIDIGDRHYEFLAFGNSQFRENGAYFFCPTEHLSCQDIRQWMGNFSDIRVVAKYAARLGQCFSTTRAIHAARPYPKPLEDIKRNGFCFTDGVGKISKMMAKMIAVELNLPESQLPPSAFQFRMGGCKGVLAVSQDVKGQEVYIRKSQQKFTAAWNGLEIIRYSRFSTATLNRQTITILSALGVPDQVFNDMLIKQLFNYSAAMDTKSVALDMLGRYIDDNYMTITIAGMVLNGFMDCHEPFLMSLMHLWRSWSIKLLKEKARIIVEDGAFLLGVTDETGTLKGHMDDNKVALPEIFLQIPDRTSKGKYTIIEGPCVIGRNPSLHPGDIRVVRAVNCEALHHLRDVVVFPQQGDRDVPSMLSGGDLDGDDFFVIWETALIPKEKNALPMNYDAATTKVLDRNVTIHDLIKFFVLYMKNDSLPTIAHAHLAQSDYLDHGVKDVACIELAALHSMAVDYVKSGVPAEMPKRLRPRRWPHFMEKLYKPKEAIYTSEKVLGQLYDRVEKIDFVPRYENAFDTRILNAYKLEFQSLKIARQIKGKYDTAMRRVMAQREIHTEFEVWSTFVMSKPRVGSDYKVQEELGNISNALKAQFREVVYEHLGTKDFKKLAPFVAAMYRVTHEEMQIALHECRSTKLIGGRAVPLRAMEPKYMPLMSFPWLFHEVLGKIATGRFQDTTAYEELEMPYVPTYSSKTKDRVQLEHDESDDALVTEHGVVRRGEELDLFKFDDGNVEKAQLQYNAEELDQGVMGDDEADTSEHEQQVPNGKSPIVVAPSSDVPAEDVKRVWNSDGSHVIGHGTMLSMSFPTFDTSSPGIKDMCEINDNLTLAVAASKLEQLRASPGLQDMCELAGEESTVSQAPLQMSISHNRAQKEATDIQARSREDINMESSDDDCDLHEMISKDHLSCEQRKLSVTEQASIAKDALQPQIEASSDTPVTESTDESEDEVVILGPIKSMADELTKLAFS